MSTVTQARVAAGFASFGLGPAVLRGIATLGFVEPRPIQNATIPATLEGRDILGLAQTGTGKTAAFALPVIERLLATPRRGPRVLVVAPTRELATQITEETRALAQFTRLRLATVFGGVSVGSQIAALQDPPDILVACPGRLLDLMGQGAVKLDRIETLVLDEADHMFDMGFLPDVQRILDALPARRQNLLFSATMPPEIRRLASRILHDPHVVELSHSRPASTIEHALYPIEEKLKLGLLERVLGEDRFVSAIVFTRTKHRAKRLAQQLDRAGHRAVALQGNMSQNARNRAMDGFRKREYDILVATDIAARGLDIEQVSHVVNYDMPGTPDAYTHRIGRTGRAEREGRAYTFVTSDDHDLVRAVERRIGATIPRRAVDGIASIPFATERLEDGRPRGGAAARGNPAPRAGSAPRQSSAPPSSRGNSAPRQNGAAPSSRGRNRRRRGRSAASPASTRRVG